MLLDDTAACPGRKAGDGHTLLMCIGCSRLYRDTPCIEPAAVLVDRQWTCAERRSLGHAADYQGKPESARPLAVGASEGGALYANAQNRSQK